MKTRGKPFRDIESAVNTMVLPHLATIAVSQLAKPDKKEGLEEPKGPELKRTGDAEANRFLDTARREPWQL